MIDLRSDTVTKPSKEMLEAMMRAPVGDDVYGEDPTINQLEALMASMTGKEAAIFAPSGTQTNLMGIMAHCERGDEYLVGQTAHTFRFEGGGAAVLGSVQPQPIDFEVDGTLSIEKIAANIKPGDDHFARTKLLCLENTVAGKVLPIAYLQEAKRICEEKKLGTHLDGARIFNASVKLNVDVRSITDCFDTVSICLSKGLGAPVGSVLCGTKELIVKAHRWRKILGGGMRQAGILAAAGIFALERNIERLRDDHDNAHFLAHELARIDEIEVDLEQIQTNIFNIRTRTDYPGLQKALQDKGIILSSPNYDGWVRCVTHLDINREDAKRLIDEVKSFFVRP
ncbi:MAG: low-specificity L-threonine aldolase [Oligoflexales bacterium]